MAMLLGGTLVSKCDPSLPASTPHQHVPSGGRIVVLNGFPGTGKLTILRRVKELLPAMNTCLLDNHLLIDPVSALVPTRNAEHYELRRKLLAPILEKIRKLAQDNHAILMTACLVEDSDTDAALLQEHLAMVRGTDVPIFWINAFCNHLVLEQRIKSPERFQGTKTKLTDVDILRGLISEHRLIKPCGSGDESAQLSVNCLDASGDVDMSAGRLMSIVGLLSNPNPTPT